MELSERDRKILSVLKNDCRLAIRDIAKRTGIRPSTVHDRIRKLKESGVIERFTIKLDNKSIGEDFIVFMLIKTKPGKLLDQKVLSDQRVKEVFGVTGEYDVMLKLKFSDVSEFNKFVIDFRKEQSVLTTLTMVGTAEIKEEI